MLSLDGHLLGDLAGLLGSEPPPDRASLLGPATHKALSQPLNVNPGDDAAGKHSPVGLSRVVVWFMR